MLQGHVPALAGELAARLCNRAGGRLRKVFFASSGSEGVEAVIKFARAHTGRPGILFAAGAFHGLTCGALSLMDNPFWTDGFGPLLPETRALPFQDLETLETALASRRYAALVLEPIQAEAGIVVPLNPVRIDRARLRSSLPALSVHGRVMRLSMARTNARVSASLRYSSTNRMRGSSGEGGGAIPVARCRARRDRPSP
jgi:ornithine--oxo-acid transaminase